MSFDGERRRLAPVDFICDRHAPRPGARTVGTLTIVERKWAYCPSVRGRQHRWIATGGVSVLRIVGARTAGRLP